MTKHEFINFLASLMGRPAWEVRWACRGEDFPEDTKQNRARCLLAVMANGDAVADQPLVRALSPEGKADNDTALRQFSLAEALCRVAEDKRQILHGVGVERVGSDVSGALRLVNGGMLMTGEGNAEGFSQLSLLEGGIARRVLLSNLPDQLEGDV